MPTQAEYTKWKQEVTEQLYEEDVEKTPLTKREVLLLLIVWNRSDCIRGTELEEMKRLAHEGLPDDCIMQEDNVKFCTIRQGDGGKCKWCSNYQ